MSLLWGVLKDGETEFVDNFFKLIILLLKNVTNIPFDFAPKSFPFDAKSKGIMLVQ